MWLDLSFFTAKAIIIVVLILCLMAGLLAIIVRSKKQTDGTLTIEKLNQHYTHTRKNFFAEIMPKKEFKAFLKDEKLQKKKQEKEKKHNVFVLHFNGDIKASAVASLREEITAIINVATKQDEVLLQLESHGGTVNGYGLASAQLMRLREKSIPLVISIDKIAASGGYMMACIANKIIAAPFAIIGSIGVIIQLPNFHRLLKEKQIDFEQHMAGNYKRTITLFGENTDQGREKLQEEIEKIHHSFKDLITTHRPQLDIDQVATGEHWLGQQALALKLVDSIQTSDAYLLERSLSDNLFKISFSVKKKSLLKKLADPSAFLRQIVSLFTKN